VCLGCVVDWFACRIGGMKMLLDLPNDLQELRQLLREAKWPRIQALLSKEKANLKKVSSFVIVAIKIGGVVWSKSYVQVKLSSGL
jgi:hypothetical protein